MVADRSLESGEYLKKRLGSLGNDHDVIGDVRGRGLLVGVELVADKKTKKMFSDSQNIASQVASLALSKGIKIFGLKGHDSGMISDFLVISPPLTIDRAQLDQIVDTIDSCVTEVEAAAL